MPELPEVESVAASLQTMIAGRTIRRIAYLAPHLLSDEAQWRDKQFREALSNAKISRIFRRAKFIIIELNESLCWLVHLRMTGRLLVHDNKPEQDRHTHAIFELDDARWLSYHDVRKFGRFFVARSEALHEHPKVSVLGPEPLEKSFQANDLYAICQASRRPIKTHLMDHTKLAGVGNIYACEALYLARLNPFRLSNSLSEAEAKELHRQIRAVLRKAIRHKGTTLSDYRRPDNELGEYAKHLHVYGRQGEACGVCGSAILRQVQAARSTFYCPGCQA